MVEINFKGYKTMLPNMVYGKDAEPLRSIHGDKFPSTEMFKISAYVVPTKEDVARHIVDAAKGIGLEEEVERTMFRGLSLESVKLIAKKDRNIMREVLDHYQIKERHKGKKYLLVKTATLPNMILEEIRTLFSKKENEAYTIAMSERGVNKWGLEIWLQNTCLPDKSEMDYLLKKGVRDSDIIFFRGDYEYSAAVKRVELLYSALSFPGALSCVADESGKFTAASAYKTIESFKQAAALKDISGLFGVISEAIDKEQPHEPYSIN